jgi:peroxiredoxin
MKPILQRATLRALALVALALVAVPLAAAAGAAGARDLPRFEAKTVDGETYKFADVLGQKVIVIDFWATYCIQCRPQLDALDKLYKQYRDRDLEVVVISVDTPQNVGKIKPYFKSRDYSFPVLLDTDSQIARVIKPTIGLPYTLLVDRQGAIVYEHEGFKKGEEKTLEALIVERLGAGKEGDGSPPAAPAAEEEGKAPAP